MVVGIKADKDKNSVYIQRPFFTGLGIFKIHGRNPADIVSDGSQHRIPQHLDSAFIFDPLLQEHAGAERIPPMGQINVLCQFRQIEGLFCRRVSPAHHHHRLVLEKKSVASGAIGNTLSVIGVLSRNIQFSRTAAQSQYYGIGIKRFSPRHFDSVKLESRLDGVDLCGQHLKAVGLGMLGKVHGEVRPSDPLDPGPVFHLIRCHDLPAVNPLFD